MRSQHNEDVKNIQETISYIRSGEQCPSVTENKIESQKFSNFNEWTPIGNSYLFEFDFKLFLKNHLKLDLLVSLK